MSRAPLSTSPPPNSSGTDETPPARQLGALALKVVVSVGLLYVLFGRSDGSAVWAIVQRASWRWLAAAMAVYFTMIVASAWRWGLLLSAQRAYVPASTLLSSFLVATFFNNFLPSNIGGDVVRIRDTAPATGSKTAASMVVFTDRLIGLLGLLFVGAIAATLSRRLTGTALAPVWAVLLWSGLGLGCVGLALLVWAPGRVTRLLRPLGMFHREWVDERLRRVADTLRRFRTEPGALAACFAGAILVQVILVAYYGLIATGAGIPVSWTHLAVIVPVSFLVQMVPVSVNGFGVREATFSYYFTALHLPIESALVLSLLGAVLIMLLSLSGALIYTVRR